MYVIFLYLFVVLFEWVEDFKCFGIWFMQDLLLLYVNLCGIGYFLNEGSLCVWFVKIEVEGLIEFVENLWVGICELGIGIDDFVFKVYIIFVCKKGFVFCFFFFIFDQSWMVLGLMFYCLILCKIGLIYEVQSMFCFWGLVFQIFVEFVFIVVLSVFQEYL